MSDLERPDDRGAELQYLRVANDIEARITSGELKPGARLLAEKDLAAYYGVSYLTVRHSIAILRDKGLVESVHGKGTFVK